MYGRDPSKSRAGFSEIGRVSTLRLERAMTSMEKIKIEQHSFSGTLWFAGWLFTIGYLHLPFFQGALAIVLWPYYVGLALAR